MENGGTTNQTSTIRNLAGPLTGTDDGDRCVSCGHLPGCDCPEDCVTQAEADAVTAAAIAEPWEAEFVQAAIMLTALDTIFDSPQQVEGVTR